MEDRTELTEVSLISKEAIPVQNVGFLTSTNLNKYISLDTFKHNIDHSMRFPQHIAVIIQ